MPKHVLSDRQYVHVIKASAGSGKTHHLTGEYLHLLFSRPNNHSHILAVTFTNKATDEMKSRIVEELFRLASGIDSPYLKELMTDFSISESAVRSQAGSILETILHDYSAFSISTIDRFFQRTMRAFTREMGLAGGFNIEVDETSLLMETIDLMLSELDRPENKTLSDWLLKFMQDRIEEGKSWKINQQVQDLSKQLFNETYKSLSDDDFALIQDKTHLGNYKQMLVRIVKSYEQEAKMIGVKALNLMEQHGLAYDDFKHKRNSGFMLFVKLSNGIIEKPSNRLIGLTDNVELWISSREKESAIRSAYAAGLNDCVHSIIQLSDNDRDYQTAKQLLRNFFTLGILNDIKLRLRKLQQDNNTLFLSDTTELLNDIISGTDSPFIYEKTGTLLTNFMIDEFQDTSRMQWDNFKPLIEESLASNNFNLIVGDVKQSIYRFRNSDWRLLEEQVENDLHSENIQKHLLNTNWRSDANIIQFYNAFFTKAATILQDDFDRAIAQTPESEADHNNRQIADAYSDVYQHVPKKKDESGGQVKITFLECDKGDEWKSAVLEQLPHEIESLQDQGFALKDIAIVVRWNHEATEVAETLLNYREQHPESTYRYDIISNEALLIGNAQSVKAVIALMRHFRNPNDKTRLMMAVYEFYRFHRNISPDEALQNFREEAAGDFPDEIRSRLNGLSSLPFYDMVESFFALSGDALDQKENAHVQAFLDIALRFSTKASSDLNDFLDWWDEKGYKKALFSPDDQDAIRLITIHKSKGLGFGAVIMPFANWEVDHKANHNNIIWCKPSVAPFDALSVAPLKYGKGLADTIFRDDYLDEKRFTYIDNLNLLYVAFTRTKHRLIAFAPRPAKPGTISTMADLLWRGITDVRERQSNDNLLISLGDHFTEGDSESIFEYGKPEKKKADAGQQSVITCQTGKWQSLPFNNRLKLRLNSIGFFTDDGSRDYGTLMHDIVSRVKYVSDIPAAVERKISEGELSELEREKTISVLNNVLSHPDVTEWYTDKYTILNEAQMLHPRFGFSRPDRVMIGNDEVIVADYKFGELEDTKYIRQVERYVKTIEEMGYTRVKGFVFYVRSGKTVPV
ncbi:MAG: UvrD-helicase domain-containing protein [Bacteroidales bacterium]|nr:UvrD-helicase domain-containing protein [Bacteroidales bacterium]